MMLGDLCNGQAFISNQAVTHKRRVKSSRGALSKWQSSASATRPAYAMMRSIIWPNRI
jgi:hypothetical protein